MIYEIRGKQVMLDSDLAILYNVETKRINEAVKNNPIKFPDRFIIIDKNKLYHFGASFKDLGKRCFEISKIEENDLINDLLKKVLCI